MRDAMMNSLFELAANNEDIMLLTGDLGFGVFEKFEKNFPKQYLNVGVAEQNMVGIASGLALEGKIVFTYSIGNFPTLRCLEQIRNDACYHELNINIIAVGGGFSYGGLGMSHHATEDLSIMRALPEITVVSPCTAWEAGQAVKAVVEEPGVSYLRIDKSKAEEINEPGIFELGKSRILRTGNDYAIITAGGIAEEAMEASESLSMEGIECRVVSMSTIKPIDIVQIAASCEETLGIITLEENNLSGGLGSAVSEVCMDLNTFPKNFKRLGMKDAYSAIVGTQKYLRASYGLDSRTIIETIKNMHN